MEIKCSFKFVQWEDNRKLYTGLVKTASVTVKGTEVNTATGRHQSKKSNEIVQGIWFTKNKLKFFPRGLQKIFPNLVALNLTDCGLTSISLEDFGGLQNLKGICLDRNLLTSLPSDLFVGFKRLKVISVRDNKLETLSSNLFNPILENGLTIVDLRGNTSINAFYAPGTAGSLGSVAQLAQEINAKCGREVEDKGASQSTKQQPTTKVTDSFVEKFQKGFKYLLETGNFSDFLIIAGAKEFHVHKCVLSIQSPTLANLFEKEKELAELTIDDFTAEAVEVFIQFMYNGELRDEVHAIELFGLSSDLQVTELRSECEKIILKKIDKCNADNIFALATRYGSEDMKKLALNEIKKMFPGIPVSDELLQNPEKLKDLIELKRKSDRAQKELEEKLTQYGMNSNS